MANCFCSVFDTLNVIFICFIFITVFPSNSETLAQLSLPIAISLCPMKNTGLDIPFVDYGEKNIPRCPNRNCRAYLNPFVKFIDGGEKWICNI